MDKLKTPSSDLLWRLSMRSFGNFPGQGLAAFWKHTYIATAAASAIFPTLTWQLKLSIYRRFLALFRHLHQPQFRENLFYMVVLLSECLICAHSPKCLQINALEYVLGLLLQFNNKNYFSIITTIKWKFNKTILVLIRYQIEILA